MIADVDSAAWTDLVLKLARHDLNIGTRNCDTSVKAGLVVSVLDSATEAYVGTDGAVERTLIAWVAILGPSEGSLGELGGCLKESVFLLDTVPNLFIFDGFFLPDLLGEVSEVGVGRDELLALVVLPGPGFAHNDDIVSSSERISEHSDGFQNHLRLFGDSLVAGGAIVVPVGEFLNA